MVATWDDHDYGWNDAGRDYLVKYESESIFEDFWGIESSSPAGSRPGIYQSYLFGPESRRVQLVLLDTRFFRSDLAIGPADGVNGPYRASSDPLATILGADQWEWLKEQISIPARVRIVVTSIQLLPSDHGWESWSNFPRERERLIRLIEEGGADGVLFISGDRHFGEISRFERAGAYPLYEVTSSGLNRGYPAPKPTDNKIRVGDYFLNHNYGSIHFSWSGGDAEITLALHDVLGRVVVAQYVKLKDLSSIKPLQDILDNVPIRGYRSIYSDSQS